MAQTGQAKRKRWREPMEVGSQELELLQALVNEFLPFVRLANPYLAERFRVKTLRGRSGILGVVQLDWILVFPVPVLRSAMLSSSHWNSCAFGIYV